MARRLTLFCLAALLALPIVARADWDPSIPAKWIQMPDPGLTGVDVSASVETILADDFRCTETGLITGIHIWGSWLYDLSCDAVFTLSIHADIPAGVQGPYSMPGEVLWHRTFQPGEYSVRVWSQGMEEGWLTPPEAYIFPADNICWQYNFVIPEMEAFRQQEGTIYWLDVNAQPINTGYLFGWKSSLDHWNDDAVWGVGAEPFPGPWYELRYPPGHEMYWQSMDLAFVLTGEPLQLDWGDAPGAYPTTAASNGASHVIGGPWLGGPNDVPDAEADGQPDPLALGDDNAGIDDENGCLVPTLVQGRNATITFEVNGVPAYVSCWIDFNGDAVWDVSEMVIGCAGPMGIGFHSFLVPVPAASVLGQTFARFRISTVCVPVPTGPAPDGEVEDYAVRILEPTKWLQAPDLTPTGIDVDASGDYILADDFLCMEAGRITEIRVWGSWLNDYLPLGGDPTAVDFTLSIHRDIPAWQSPTGYSMPGEPLWILQMLAGQFIVETWQDGIEEGWLYPPETYYFPGDHVCWLYTFHIPPEQAFFQAGSEAEPIVYWLDLHATPRDQSAAFGWKTSLDHWNDDAVWGLGPEPYPGPWRELRYPPGHPYVGQSMDLAFGLRNDAMSGTPSIGGTDAFDLFQNEPNPFRSTTTMQYSLPSGGGHVKVLVFDVTGRAVATLVDEKQEGGTHSAAWDGRDSGGHEVAAGVYFCRLSLGDKSVTRSMIYLK